MFKITQPLTIHIFFFFTIFQLFFSSFSSSSYPLCDGFSTICVPINFPTIQSAINNISSNPTHKIFIRQGVYNEKIVLSHDMGEDESGAKILCEIIAYPNEHVTIIGNGLGTQYIYFEKGYWRIHSGEGIMKVTNGNHPLKNHFDSLIDIRANAWIGPLEIELKLTNESLINTMILILIEKVEGVIIDNVDYKIIGEGTSVTNGFFVNINSFRDNLEHVDTFLGENKRIWIRNSKFVNIPTRFVGIYMWRNADRITIENNYFQTHENDYTQYVNFISLKSFNNGSNIYLHNNIFESRLGDKRISTLFLIEIKDTSNDRSFENIIFQNNLLVCDDKNEEEYWEVRFESPTKDLINFKLQNNYLLGNCTGGTNGLVKFGGTEIRNDGCVDCILRSNVIESAIFDKFVGGDNQIGVITQENNVNGYSIELYNDGMKPIPFFRPIGNMYYNDIILNESPLFDYDNKLRSIAFDKLCVGPFEFIYDLNSYTCTQGNWDPKEQCAVCKYPWIGSNCEVCNQTIADNEFYNECLKKGSNEEELRKILIIVGSSVGGGLVLIGLILVFCICCCYCMKKKKTTKNERLLEDLDDNEKESAKIEIDSSLSKIKTSDIELKNRIGAFGGSDSQVFLGLFKGIKVAVKLFKTNDVYSAQYFDDFESEVKIVSSIQHPKIVNFLGACVSSPRVMIVFEYCNLGDLSSYIGNRENRISKQLKIKWLFDIAAALEYLHDRKIIHRDLKPSNVLLKQEDDRIVAKITDFGVSRVCKQMTQDKTRRVGTSFYMAPEVLLSSQYNYRVDIFSFSILSYVLWEENLTPYRGIDKDDLNVEVKVASRKEFRPIIHDQKYTKVPWLKDLIVRNWNHEPKRRNTASELRKMIQKYI